MGQASLGPQAQPRSRLLKESKGSFGSLPPSSADSLADNSVGSDAESVVDTHSSADSHSSSDDEAFSSSAADQSVADQFTAGQSTADQSTADQMVEVEIHKVPSLDEGCIEFSFPVPDLPVRALSASVRAFRR